MKVSGVDKDGLTGATKARAVRVSGKRLVTRTRTVTLPANSHRGLDYPRGCNGCLEYPQCGTVEPSSRFSQPGALSYRSGPGCGDRQGRWIASTHHQLALREVAPRGYGSVTVSLFGGPTTPGAADQGELAVVYGATYTRTSTGSTYTGGTSTTVLTGPDTGGHTTAAPTGPISVIQDDDGVGVPGFEWYFRTREGASYDVASFTLTYTFLTPQS